ncbi:unnamed protein product [Tilletia caries]|uniref:Uncharacterized protein n=1 Tax=Tilletia caries TaxID=13290 RepID=A0A177T047_9BASI|nr:hypothetical protein CF335_g8886 [Tilletia laevis]KAE8185427.1 hypothetical protein CF336_g7413 [Tilletia laevis]KAE8238864.1 hypothetical protein A4X03_0g8755 [Tilletia caries]CAD6888203.1 unnamed protein product [Tilletia caries]CAD6985189.1 unnamed protein product [Tilletia controversa]
MRAGQHSDFTFTVIHSTLTVQLPRPFHQYYSSKSRDSSAAHHSPRSSVGSSCIPPPQSLSARSFVFIYFIGFTSDSYIDLAPTSRVEVQQFLYSAAFFPGQASSSYQRDRRRSSCGLWRAAQRS